MRVQVYRYPIDRIRSIHPDLDISLRLEERAAFEALHLREALALEVAGWNILRAAVCAKTQEHPSRDERRGPGDACKPQMNADELGSSTCSCLPLPTIPARIPAPIQTKRL